MSDRDGKTALVVGMTGSGKTVYTQKKMENAPRLLVFDPKRSYQKLARKLGLYVARDLADCVDTLLDNRDSNFRVVFQPDVMREQEQLSDLCLLLERMQEPYLMGKSDKKVLLVAEELHQANPNPPSRDLVGFMRAVQMGRESGIDIIGVTQLPQQVSTFVRQNLTTLVCFEVAGKAAAEGAAFCADGSKDVEAAIMGLSGFRHLVYQGKSFEVRDPLPLT